MPRTDQTRLEHQHRGDGGRIGGEVFKTLLRLEDSPFWNDVSIIFGGVFVLPWASRNTAIVLFEAFLLHMSMGFRVMKGSTC